MKYVRMAIIVPFLLLSGCNRVIQWGKDNFYQGEQVRTYSKIPREYLKSVIAYDQFMTQAVFDVIWLSDAVRAAYVEAFASRTGKSQEQKNMLFRRELEENNHYITFYVLSLYNIPLLESSGGDWSIYLKIDDVVYHPIEIKYLEINPEYRMFFGRVFSRFKTPYQVKFNAKNVDCKPIITTDTEKVELYFRSVKKEVKLTWNVTVLSDTVMIKDPEYEKIVRQQRERKPSCK